MFLIHSTSPVYAREAFPVFRMHPKGDEVAKSEGGCEKEKQVNASKITNIYHQPGDKRPMSQKF